MALHEGTGAYHRRFRPQNLNEYIGNTEVKNAVFAALRGNVRPQVILLQGHAGCGKTSMGRLLAMEYNCEDRNELTGACGVCPTCETYKEYIETGDTTNVFDLYEYDCSKIGKSESTAIEENMKSGSLTGGWKVYIFDEAHLLTAGAEGGLLKVIEEPPERVLIILCTTNPEDILDTIKSRCQLTLTVSKPSREELCKLLAFVCNHEHVEFEDKALSAICIQSSYVPRQALIALDTVVTARGMVTLKDVTEVLRVISEDYYFQFYDILCADYVNIFEYVRFLGKLKENVNLEAFIDNLIEFTTRGLYIYNGVKMDGVDAEEIKHYKAIFSKFNSADIANILTLLMETKASRNFEAKLLLMGYTGLRAKKISDNNDDVFEVTKNECTTEATMSGNAYIESRKPSEEDIQKGIDESLSSISKRALLEQFGAELHSSV